MRRLSRAWFAIVAVAVLPGCDDKREAAYPDVAAAEVAGAFARGWLPALLPRDATNIAEVHDLDTNETWACFDMPRGTDLLRENLRLAKAQRVSGPVGPRPTRFLVARSWWPSSMFEPGGEAHRMSVGDDSLVVGIREAGRRACFYQG